MSAKNLSVCFQQESSVTTTISDEAPRRWSADAVDEAPGGSVTDA